MTDWTPIQFEDIRKGDRIRSTIRRHGQGLEEYYEVRAGVVDSYAHGGWYTNNGDGYAVANRESTLTTLELDPDSRPKEPEVPAGTTGTAKVEGEAGIKVMRFTSLAGVDMWFSAERVDARWTHADDRVTDFVPDETYPHPGLEDITVLGPEVMTDANETVINYKGAHYVRQDEILTDEKAEQIRAEERKRIAGTVDRGRHFQAQGFASFEHRDNFVAWLRDGAK